MSHLVRARMILMCLLIGLASSLYAQDAVTLIDQTRALAGNITPGDAPGFPVTISRSGSYRLEGNLVIQQANGTAIQITAPNVTLDLNGFSIIGPGGCTAAPQSPPQCSPPGQGVGIQAGSDSITGNTSTFNQGAGIIADCPSVVAENTAVQNAHNNIEPVENGCVVVNDVTFP